MSLETKARPKAGDSAPRNGVPERDRSGLVICDDHPIVREQLVAELALAGLFESVEGASDVSSLVELVESGSPAIALVDIELPDDDGLNGVDRVAEVDESVRVVILSAHHDDELVAEAKRRGAAGFVSKSDARSELLDVLEAVLDGGESFPPVDGRGDRIERLLSLSPREREILDLVADGRKADEIADVLGIGRATVYTHVRNAMARLGVNSRGEAIALSVRYSYLRPRY